MLGPKGQLPKGQLPCDETAKDGVHLSPLSKKGNGVSLALSIYFFYFKYKSKFEERKVFSLGTMKLLATTQILRDCIWVRLFTRKSLCDITSHKTRSRATLVKEDSGPGYTESRLPESGEKCLCIDLSFTRTGRIGSLNPHTFESGVQSE